MAPGNLLPAEEMNPAQGIVGHVRPLRYSPNGPYDAPLVKVDRLLEFHGANPAVNLHEVALPRTIISVAIQAQAMPEFMEGNALDFRWQIKPDPGTDQYLYFLRNGPSEHAIG